MGPPRGMLMHITMRILRQHPMSGSELMEEIKKYSDWRPSPGSIYPLLAKLQEDRLIMPQADQDPSLKRFKLTKKGGEMLEEHSRFDEQFKIRNKTIRKIYWRLHRQMPEDIYKALADFLEQVEETYQNIGQDPESEQMLINILGCITEKIEEMEMHKDE
jgi:DNA-binding PadR family transcriptional regulator